MGALYESRLGGASTLHAPFTISPLAPCFFQLFPISFRFLRKYHKVYHKVHFTAGSCRSLSPKSMDRIVRMGRVKEEEPHVKYKTRMSDFATCFARLHLIACILWQSIKPSLVFLIRKRLHAFPGAVTVREVSFFTGRGVSICDRRSPIFSGPPLSVRENFWPPPLVT